MKHFKSVEDLTREEYLEIFKLANRFSTGEDHSYLCRGKILSTIFFQESLRTVNVFKSAMIRLGGGVIGMEGVAGTYLATGEEDKEDTLREFGLLSDIMVTRDKDPETLDIAARVAGVPVINGGSGIQEHASGVFYFGYELFRKFGKIDGLKIAIYGAPGPSRPIKSMMKWFSLFENIEIFTDIVIPELDLSQDIYEYAEKNGLKVTKAKLEDIIQDIDALFVEAVPVKFVNEDIVGKYLEAYKPITLKEVSMMKKDAVIGAVAPRIIKDDLLSVSKDVDSDQRFLLKSGSKNWSYAIMALIVKLLGLKVE